MTRGRAIAGALGLVAMGAAVWWFARPDAVIPATPVPVTATATASPTVRPQSPDLPRAQAPDADTDALTDEEQRARMDALADYRSWLADRLAAEDTARSLALAVHLLAPGGYDPSDAAAEVDPRVPGWFARARAIAGDDGVAWSFLMTVVGSRVRASSDANDTIALAWAEHDPHNLAPWLYLSRDAAPPEDWLGRARSPRAHVTLHWLDTEAVVLAAYRRYPPPPTWRAHLVGEGRWAEAGHPLGLAPPLSLPPLQRLMAVCAPRDRRVKPLPACAPAARAMVERSDTLLAEAMGLSIARRTGGDGRLPADLRARERVSRWHREQLWRLSEAESSAAMAEYLLEAPPLTERAYFIHAFERAGIPATPPAGWNPPEQR